MSTLVKKETTRKRTIAQLRNAALTKNHCQLLKGGDGQSTDGIIVHDVVIH